MNVPNQGAPQSTIVDGFQAVRDGRTVYVGATNLANTGDDLYSNLYLISYNQGASSQTQEIFNRILDRNQQQGVWSFNADFSNHRICQDVGYYRGTDLVCGRDVLPAQTEVGISQASYCSQPTFDTDPSAC